MQQFSQHILQIIRTQKTYEGNIEIDGYQIQLDLKMFGFGYGFGKILVTTEQNNFVLKQIMTLNESIINRTGQIYLERKTESEYRIYDVVRIKQKILDLVEKYKGGDFDGIHICLCMQAEVYDEYKYMLQKAKQLTEYEQIYAHIRDGKVYIILCKIENE